MSWSFTPDEFAHVWRGHELDRHPFPLRIRESPRTAEDAAALRRTLAARLPAGADPDLSACLRILARPASRIVTVGGGHTPGSEIRALGAVVHDHAVLAVQEPNTVGRVDISIGHTNRLGARIVALLPDTPAGAEPAHSAPAGAVRDDAPSNSPTAPRIRRLLLRPHTAEGHVRVETGLDTEDPEPPAHYAWIDVEGDGRYLIRAGRDVHVAPTTAQQLARHLTTRLGR
ncbi:ESX secretion-associated protein EspG [Nocardia stercoris]|uniref:ESX secretion-associated protein EspG n=1 Tax=Nocardia stercoris TaxID=2483361 RepID=A0A3M2L923_9NOCA|nr:ESX secretion-associated protein EspG [Nocardia stercoris]RMI33023.1 ESX secretion-associated protein EspG [Nocardia stercoris]